MIRSELEKIGEDLVSDLASLKLASDSYHNMNRLVHVERASLVSGNLQRLFDAKNIFVDAVDAASSVAAAVTKNDFNDECHKLRLCLSVAGNSNADDLLRDKLDAIKRHRLTIASAHILNSTATDNAVLKIACRRSLLRYQQDIGVQCDGTGMDGGSG